MPSRASTVGALLLAILSRAADGSRLQEPAAPATPADNEVEVVSMLQKTAILQKSPEGAVWPMLLPLLRESVPITKKGKVVAHKTSYSGAIRMGQQAQEFRVVFDTGSGHIVLPSETCHSESCTLHKRYDLSASATAHAVNLDGGLVPKGELGDQVTIGYGTGEVTGEFAKDKVCFDGTGTCVNVSFVMAVEMTAHPFSAFNFDGIFGLSLDGLAVSPEFSFASRLGGAGLGAASQFGFFLAGADATEELGSEIALGGYNRQRMLTPVQWAPVADADQGYWQVAIRAVRVGNVTLDMCQDGSCKAVVDTGTSHLGVPSKRMSDFANPLMAEATEGTDCRHVQGPPVEFDLDGLTLTLNPVNYMRPLPLRKGTTLGGLASQAGLESSLTCAAKLMPVKVPGEALGSNVFILGEPLLHRYYTVYDWETKRIGFGLSDIPSNRAALAEDPATTEPAEDVFSFVQVTLTVSVRVRGGRASATAPCGPTDTAAAEAEAIAALEADWSDGGLGTHTEL